MAPADKPIQGTDTLVVCAVFPEFFFNLYLQEQLNALHKFIDLFTRKDKVQKLLERLIHLVHSALLHDEDAFVNLIEDCLELCTLGLFLFEL